jgi:hypothetical protein
MRMNIIAAFRADKPTVLSSAIDSDKEGAFLVQASRLAGAAGTKKSRALLLEDSARLLKLGRNSKQAIIINQICC